MLDKLRRSSKKSLQCIEMRINCIAGVITSAKAHGVSTQLEAFANFLPNFSENFPYNLRRVPCQAPNSSHKTFPFSHKFIKIKIFTRGPCWLLLKARKDAAASRSYRLKLRNGTSKFAMLLISCDVHRRRVCNASRRELFASPVFIASAEAQSVCFHPIRFLCLQFLPIFWKTFLCPFTACTLPNLSFFPQHFSFLPPTFADI